MMIFLLILDIYVYFLVINLLWMDLIYVLMDIFLIIKG